MRIVYFSNNHLGLEILKHIVQEGGDEIAGIVVHPKDRAKYRDEIVKAAGLPKDRVFDGSALGDPAVVERIVALEAEMGLSVLFGYILKREVLRVFPKGVVNLHPAYLPYNRGAYPNVWPIVESTPAGATLHFIDEGIDTGDVIAQMEVAVEPVDTGETLYRKLEAASLALFRETWGKIREGAFERIPQDPALSTSHRTRDVDRIDEIDPDREYKASDLLNVLRARTFGETPGAYFMKDGRKVFVKVHLSYGKAGFPHTEPRSHGDE